MLLCAWQMTVGNTAAVFAPNLLRSEHDGIDQLADTVHVVNLVAIMIQLADTVFDVARPTSEPSGAAAAAFPLVAGPVLLQPAPQPSSASSKCLQSPRASLKQASSSDLSTQEGPLRSSTSKADPRHPEVGAVTDASSKPQKWFYVNSSHQQEGPVDLQSLQAMLRDSRLSARTFVYTEGMSSWTPAGAVEILK